MAPAAPAGAQSQPPATDSRPQAELSPRWGVVVDEPIRWWEPATIDDRSLILIGVGDKRVLLTDTRRNASGVIQFPRPVRLGAVAQSRMYFFDRWQIFAHEFRPSPADSPLVDARKLWSVGTAPSAKRTRATDPEFLTQIHTVAAGQDDVVFVANDDGLVVQLSADDGRLLTDPVETGCVRPHLYLTDDGAYVLGKHGLSTRVVWLPTGGAAVSRVAEWEAYPPLSARPAGERFVALHPDRLVVSHPDGQCRLAGFAAGGAGRPAAALVPMASARKSVGALRVLLTGATVLRLIEVQVGGDDGTHVKVKQMSDVKLPSELHDHVWTSVQASSDGIALVRGVTTLLVIDTNRGAVLGSLDDADLAHAATRFHNDRLALLVADSENKAHLRSYALEPGLPLVGHWRLQTPGDSSRTTLGWSDDQAIVRQGNHLAGFSLSAESADGGSQEAP